MRLRDYEIVGLWLQKNCLERINVLQIYTGNVDNMKDHFIIPDGLVDLFTSLKMLSSNRIMQIMFKN